MTLSIDVSATFSAEGAEPFAVDAGFDVEAGETVVVLGPSGSGKTLLLETVAGFHPHEGTVALDGSDLTDAAPEERDFGFVFQDYALFPHMTVTENVEYGGRYHDETREVEDLLADLGVPHLGDRYPGTLSGGEKQRVALARSLYVRPGVLLLDEPLSSLDVPTRDDLREDMLDVLDGVTAIYVTHDRTTARALADRVVVMRDGAIVQRGTTGDVFERPASPFVARFTGSNCLALSAELREAIDVPAEANWLAIRPEDVRLADERPDVTATVERVLREDAAHRVALSIDGERIEAYAADPPEVGASVGVSFEAASRTLL